MCETIFRIYRISGIQIWGRCAQQNAAMRTRTHYKSQFVSKQYGTWRPGPDLVIVASKLVYNINIQCWCWVKRSWQSWTHGYTGLSDRQNWSNSHHATLLSLHTNKARPVIYGKVSSLPATARCIHVSQVKGTTESKSGIRKPFLMFETWYSSVLLHLSTHHKQITTTTFTTNKPTSAPWWVLRCKIYRST